VEQLAERFGSDLKPTIRTLSHGNRQKLGLIQAFMHRPELVVLDEPTVGLDPLMQHEFYALVADARRAGQTVFLSSHVIPEIERTCDRVAILRGGKLITVERISALKAKAIRHVEIRFARPVPADAFADLPGMRDLTVRGEMLHSAVLGSMDPLVKAAARFEVVEITSQEPSLEELFLTYYEPTPGTAQAPSGPAPVPAPAPTVGATPPAVSPDAAAVPEQSMPVPESTPVSGSAAPVSESALATESDEPASEARASESAAPASESAPVTESATDEDGHVA
jgi:energy-coupling factor transporter ATP-binding protein EcfA2